MRRTQSAFAGFEDGGKGPRAKECEWLLEAGKSKETDSPLEPLEGTGTP